MNDPSTCVWVNNNDANKKASTTNATQDNLELGWIYTEGVHVEPNIKICYIATNELSEICTNFFDLEFILICPWKTQTITDQTITLAPGITGGDVTFNFGYLDITPRQDECPLDYMRPFVKKDDDSWLSNAMCD